MFVKIHAYTLNDSISWKDIFQVRGIFIYYKSTNGVYNFKLVNKTLVCVTIQMKTTGQYNHVVSLCIIVIR